MLSDPIAVVIDLGATLMIDENLARLRAHRQNIDRYRRLLQTSLAAVEREFIERRIAEEEDALARVAAKSQRAA